MQCISREKETVAVVRLETSLPGVESRLARAAGPKHRRDEMRRGKKIRANATSVTADLAG